MVVTVQKCPTPILWLDTSILIKIAKHLTGEHVAEPDATRVSNLYDAIRARVGEKNLLCPGGDQREEFTEGRRLVDVIERVQADLSMGISFEHRQGIEDAQILRGIRACIGRDDTLTLSYNDAFHRNPIEQLRQEFHVIVRIREREDWITRHTQIINNIREQFETLREELVAECDLGRDLGRGSLNSLPGLLQSPGPIGPPSNK